MKKILITGALLIMVCVTFAQSPDWTIVPNLLHFTSSAVTPGAMPGSYTTPYSSSNCGYDNNGNILFYVVDGKVYNNMGVSAGSLSFGFGTVGRDIIIVPDPGNCNAHLIIHTSSDIVVGGGSCTNIKQVLCTRVTHTGTALSIQTNYFVGNNIIDCNDLAISICVSKPLANGSRYLYAICNGQVYKYLIGSTGISLTGSFNQGISSSPTDAEVSVSVDKVAWASAIGGSGFSICWINLDANGNFLNIQHIDASPSLYPAYGLEFIDNNKVMVAAGAGANGGIYEANLTTTPTAALKISTGTYYYSNLEKALDGKIYAASLTGLMGIDAAYNTTNISLAVKSNVNGTRFFSLPKQLDYENYAQVFSCTPACPSNVIISGSYIQPLTQSQDWIMTSGLTTIPTGANVKLDAEPTAGYVELNDGFETQTGSVFIAQALDGCGPLVPMIAKKSGNTQSSATIAGTKKTETGKLLVYPNPANSSINFKLPSIQTKDAVIQIADTRGQIVNAIKVSNTNSFSIPTSTWAAGSYFYVIIAEGVIVNKGNFIVVH